MSRRVAVRHGAKALAVGLVLAGCSSPDAPPTLIDGIEFGAVEHGTSSDVPLVSEALSRASEVSWQTGTRGGSRTPGLVVRRTAVFASFDQAGFSALTEGVVMSDCVYPLGVSEGLIGVVPQTEPSCSAAFDREWTQGDSGANFYFFEEDRVIYVIVGSD